MRFAGYEVNCRYRAFADAPVNPATTVAATRGFAPASTSRRTASSASSVVSAVGAGAPPTTSTTSPRGGCPAYRAASSAAVPRTTSSWTFVSSRQTATGRSGSSSASAASVAGTRRGDSNATSVSAAENAARSSEALRGKKPTKRQASAGNALATRAATGALGPGRTSTASPAATQPCTRT